MLFKYKSTELTAQKKITKIYKSTKFIRDFEFTSIDQWKEKITRVF